MYIKNPRGIVHVFFMIGLIFCFSTHIKTADASSWYNSSFGYRKAITIDHTKVGIVNNTDQANFPVLISLTDTDLKNNAQTNGNDILFTSSDGTTKLNHEIEKYNSATGEIEVWVQIPILSHSSDTVIYMYYGNPSASNQQNVAGTWNDGGVSNYLGIYHLPDGSNLSPVDSTGMYNGTNNSTIATSSGKIDGAASFNGSSSAIFNNVFSVRSNSGLTFSSWAKLESTGTNYTIADVAWGYIDLQVSASNVFWVVHQTGGVNQCIKPFVSSLNTWHLYTGTFDDTTHTWNIYVDGSFLGSCATNGTPNFASNTVLTLGSYFRGNGGSFFNGAIDEFEASSVARSADWIKTEYNNQNSPNLFYSVGLPEVRTPSPVINSFTANPSLIQSSENSTLSWDIAGVVNYITIDPINFSTFSPSGSKLVNPNTTTTYILSAGNSNGTTTQSVTVTIDSSSPTIPSNLSISTTTPSSIAFSWNVSTDNVGVSGYNIYRNGTKVATILPGTYVNSAVNSPLYDYYVDTGLSPATQYTYTVDAFDSHGNTSLQSRDLIATTLNQANFSSVEWNAGYYMSSLNPFLPVSSIYWSNLTHIIHGPALPLSDGTIDLKTYPVATDAPALISAAHAHNVKVLLSLMDGNWAGTNDFPGATANHMTTFVDNIVSAVNTYGYDGVDIDWEANINWSQMSTLISSLRAKLGTKIITVAAEPGDYNNWARISSNLDRLNLMVYDLTGLWDPYLYHDSSIYSPNNNVNSISLALNRYLTSGILASKINLGIPFYGYVYQGGCQTASCTDGLYSPLQTWTTAPTRTQRSIGYLQSNYNLTPANTSWHWDITAHEPYLSIKDPLPSNDKFITFENVQSITDKINYIQSNNLGGIFNWNMNMDYNSSAQTDSQKYPLSNIISLVYNLNSNVSENSGTTQNPPVQSGGGAYIPPYTPPTGGGGGGVYIPPYTPPSGGGSSPISVSNPIPTYVATSTITSSPITATPQLDRNLYRSVSGEDVTTLQKFLFSRGYLTEDNITGFFGPITEQAVKKFQTRMSIISYGTPSTTGFGIVGPTTRAKINSLLPNLVLANSNSNTSTVLDKNSNSYMFTRNLSLGMKGDDVRELQKFLNSHGFIITTVGDGSPGNEIVNFGNLTYRALVKYQNAKGITPASGFFGPLTRSVIKNNSN